MKHFACAVFTTALTTLVLSVCLPTADGCAPVMREGQQVAISEETALIMWDPQSKTEHFIRSAQFSTNAEDFGFLVPTPTEPTLSETNPSVFGHLDRFTRAKVRVVTKTKSIFRWFEDEPTDTRALPTSAPPVQVLQQKTIGGYDAAVLKANDANALAEWLRKNNYATRPALTEWLQHYVENNWVITAFKLTQTAASNRYIFADPVRLTFKTDKPFYPYREPADMRGPNVAKTARKLKVFFVSNEKHSVTLGDDQPSAARTVFAKPASDTTLISDVASGAKLSDDHAFSEHCWVTEFEDNSPQRNGIDELFFNPSEDQTKIERPEIVSTRTVKKYYPNLPRGTMWLGLAVLLPAGWFLRRTLKRS